MHSGWWLACLLLLACDDPPTRRPCGPLPDPSACPANRGGTCEDRSCSALYLCRAGSWEVVEACPDNPAGQAGAAGAAGAAGQGGAGQAGNGLCEAPPVGCVSLQPPDCDAALLDLCPAELCALGCGGFLRCEGSDWSEGYVASCDENGELVELP